MIRRGLVWALEELRIVVEDALALVDRRHGVRVEKAREARLSDLAYPEIADELRALLSRETAARYALGEMDEDGGAR